jgi:hypothetical protein
LDAAFAGEDACKQEVRRLRIDHRGRMQVIVDGSTDRTFAIVHFDATLPNNAFCRVVLIKTDSDLKDVSSLPSDL